MLLAVSDNAACDLNSCDPHFDSMEDRVEEYRTIREEIFKEHSQINSRMSWFLLYQTLLVGGVTLLISTKEHSIIPITLSVVGALLSFLVFFSINAARKKIRVILRPKEKE